jgi:hypothetical protein
MPDANSKQKITRALASNSGLAELACLPTVGSKDGARLLQWLDHSGLALYFLNRTNTHSSEECIPDPWRDALEGRRRRNTARLQDMLGEFRRLNAAFRTNGIKVITLKGFSLFPDFCPDPVLRHQTDFDFLVRPGEAGPVAEVLRSQGYATPKLSYSGESFFSTALRRVPSRTDDLYAIQHHRQIDLHVSLAESSPWLPFEFSGSDHPPVPMNLAGIDFYGLSLELRFLGQVLHAFRHSFRSWLRLSWLLEIGHCMEIHHADHSLWVRLLEAAGNSLLIKRVFAFILTLTHRLFGDRIPGLLAEWSAEAMTPTMLLWLERFSGGWALADWPGSLSNLFLAPDFIPDSRLRRDYLRSRLIPKRERLSIETRSVNDLERPFRWQFQRWKYVAHRAGVHLTDLARFPLVQWRWQRALGSARAELKQAHS